MNNLNSYVRDLYAQICSRNNIELNDDDSEKESISEEDRQRGEGIKFQRLRRITGYLVGTVDRWNDGKRAELKDRVKHKEYDETSSDKEK